MSDPPSSPSSCSSSSDLDDNLSPAVADGSFKSRPRIRAQRQPTHTYDTNGSGRWLVSNARNSTSELLLVPPTLAILTWNIDFSRDLPVHRLTTVLDYLENLLLPVPDTSPATPTIILLQEVHQACFHALLSHPFVRTTYDVTDASPSAWPGIFGYGTVTLIPKSIASNISVFRTQFSNSTMGRDALYVDFEFLQPSSGSTNPKTQKTKIRVANVHLESLGGHGDRARPAQLKSVSTLLKYPGIYGGIVGGDMNAISPSDFNLPEEVGLSDAWTMQNIPTNSTPAAVTVGSEGEPNPNHPDITPTNQEILEADGYTWGYQPPSRFPPGRLDKILFVGAFKVDEIWRVGVGLEYNRPPGLQLGPKRKIWASDHYGLLAKFTISEKESDLVRWF